MTERHRDRDEEEDGWLRHRLMILHRLDELSKQFEGMEAQNRADHQHVVSELSSVKSEIAQLKTKASFFGALAGLGSSAAVLVATLFGFRPH